MGTATTSTPSKRPEAATVRPINAAISKPNRRVRFQKGTSGQGTAEVTDVSKQLEPATPATGRERGTGQMAGAPNALRQSFVINNRYSAADGVKFCVE